MPLAHVNAIGKPVSRLDLRQNRVRIIEPIFARACMAFGNRRERTFLNIIRARIYIFIGALRDDAQLL